MGATKRQRIEEALAGMYQYRYNVLDSSVLFKEKGEESFIQHTNYHMNSIIRKIDKEHGETVTESMYYSIVMSDFTESFHPVKYYFFNHLKELGKSAGTANIEALAATVKVDNPETWYLSLKRWLVASVANGLNDRGCQNHTCIVMTGGMGVGKTTWLMKLCPPSLAPDSIFTGKIDLNLANKDTFMLLATKFIINLDDQLRNLMKKDSETMKTIVTQPEVTIRRPFAKFSETLPRIGNFLASINGDQFLAEDENRRFLPFRVLDIDHTANNLIDMDQVWNEALTLFLDGYKYWWSKEELLEAFPDMQSFAYASDEFELIASHFEIPATKEYSNMAMNASEIMAFLKSKTGIQLSTKKIGEAMKTLKAIQVTVRDGGVPLKKYALIDKSKSDTPRNLMNDVVYNKPTMQV
jgi:predicted P-loop ATPase